MEPRLLLLDKHVFINMADTSGTQPSFTKHIKHTISQQVSKDALTE